MLACERACSPARAAVTKRLSSLNNMNPSLYGPEAARLRRGVGGVGGLVPGGGGHSPWLAGGRFSPWPHAAVPLRMSVSSSYEDTSHSGLGPTLMASLYQITSLKVIKGPTF